MNNEEMNKELIVALLQGGGLTTDEIHQKLNAINKVCVKYQTKACIDMLCKFVMWYNKRNFDSAEKVFKKHGLIPEEFIEQFKLSMEDK